MAVLTVTACLPCILGIGNSFFGDCFSVCDLGSANIGLDLELAQHTVDNNLKMKLAHASDDCLTCFGVGVVFESRVFLRELLQRDAHFLLACLCLRLNGDADNGLGELHGLKDDRVALIAKGVARCGELNAYNRGDVTCVAYLYVLSVVGVHLQDSAHSFVFALG